MSDKESAKSVIEAHHRRQQRFQKEPLILGIFAVLLVVVAAIIIFWTIAPEKPKVTFLASDTPTPTITSTKTATATLAPTATNTATLPPPTDTPMPTSTETPSGPSVYVIQEGDSLSSIAKKFNTSLEVLMALNPNINPDMIRVGEQVIIPAPNTELPTTTPVPADLAKGTIIEYRVVTGDSLGAIAERFNSTVDEILKKNPEIKKADDIKAGQVIKVPVNIVTPIPTATQGTVLPTIVPPATSTSTPQG